jgi:hypothetical protein
MQHLLIDSHFAHGIGSGNLNISEFSTQRLTTQGPTYIYNILVGVSQVFPNSSNSSLLLLLLLLEKKSY